MSNIEDMKAAGPKWYVAHTYSGYEQKVKASLEKIVENRGLGDKILDIQIPIETVTTKDGDKEATCFVTVIKSDIVSGNEDTGEEDLF